MHHTQVLLSVVWLREGFLADRTRERTQVPMAIDMALKLVQVHETFSTDGAAVSELALVSANVILEPGVGHVHFTALLAFVRLH